MIASSNHVSPTSFSGNSIRAGESHEGIIKMLKIMFSGMLLFSVCAHAQEKNCDERVSEYIRNITPWFDAKGKLSRTRFLDVNRPGSRVNKIPDKTGTPVFSFIIKDEDITKTPIGEHKIVSNGNQIRHHHEQKKDGEPKVTSETIITLDKNCNVFSFSEVEYPKIRTVTPSGCLELRSLGKFLDKNPNLADDQIEQKLKKIEENTGTKYVHQDTLTPWSVVSLLEVTCSNARFAGMKLEATPTKTPSNSSPKFPSSEGDGATKAQ